MKKLSLSLLLALALLTATIGVAAAAAEGKTAYTAGLSGSNSDAHGQAVFVFSDDGSQMKFKLVVNGLENTLMAHIHVAPTPGADGPPVLWLYPDAPPPSLIAGVFNGILGGRTTTAVELTGAAGIASFEDLIAAINEGRAYVNVHTSAFPGGEIRGDIR